MIITNKEVIQSYLITAARYDFNVHEKRIIYRLVEMCQMQLEGKHLNAGFRMDKTLFGDYIVEIPISAFLAHEDDNNQAMVKDALRRLRNKTIELEDEKEWKLIGIIEKPKFEKKGIAKFEIQPEIFDAILNFSKGYRKYELKIAFEFESSYAMRFYELLSGKTTAITYKIENLKIMFKLENKYKQINDFIRKVIEPAQKELDEKAPFSFKYKIVKEGKKIVAFTFLPYATKNIDNDLETKRLQQQTSLRWDLDKMVIDYLMQVYYFDDTEIKRNIDTFKEAYQKLDLMLFMSKKKRLAEGKKSPKGYLINAIKSELKAIREKEAEQHSTGTAQEQQEYEQTHEVYTEPSNEQIQQEIADFKAKIQR